MSSDKTHRAFRISDQLWNDFTEITQREGITATAAITRFLQTCVLNGSVKWLDHVDTVNTKLPHDVSTVETVARPDVNTRPNNLVNTTIEIEDVKGLTDVLTTLQQSVTERLNLRETVERLREDLTQSQNKVESLERQFQQETDQLYQQLELVKATHISYPLKVTEDEPNPRQTSEAEYVNTKKGIESDNVNTSPTVQSEPTSPPKRGDTPKKNPPKKTLRRKNPELALRATPEMPREKLAHLVREYIDMGMMIGDVSKEFRERGIPDPYGLSWSIGDVKKLIHEYLP